MASTAPPSGKSGPRKEPYNKNGVKYATMVNTKETLDKIPTVRLNSEDVVIATYPKAGTTWTQEIVYLIMNDADTVKANKKSIEEHFSFFEFGFPGAPPEMDKLAGMASPRLIKTHMPYPMMANQVNRDKSKFIVVMRNPRDTLVSLYYFYKSNRGLGLYPGTWDEFYEEIIRTDEVITGCPVQYSIDWWKNKDKDNVLVLFYEDMKTHLRASVEQMAEFLGKDLTPAQIDIITEASSFEAMKINPATNYVNYPQIDQSKCKFIRKGIIGDWKNHFNKEQLDYYDGILKKLEGTGLQFQYTE